MSRKCLVVLLELGVSAFDENKSLVTSRKFQDPVTSFRLLKSGGLSSEIIDFINDIRKFESVSVNEQGLAYILRQKGLDASVISAEEQQEIQNSKPEYIVKSKFEDSEYSAADSLREFAIKLSSSRVKEASEKLDLHIIQSVNALDEIDKIINTVATRMREWYGLHFPELDNLISSISTYAEIVSRSGSRDKITIETLIGLGLQERKSEIILDAARRSKGGDMTPENLAIVKKLAEEVVSLSELRRILAEHLEVSMELIAPNIKELLTALVGARIIARAGSMSRLATLPASTIQVLGAEKALFRSLKTGARPPKHGILFQHPIIHSAPKWQRGKLARAVSSKLAIAARIDLYRQSGRDESIIAKLSERISEIQEKYKNPVSEKELIRRNREHLQRSHTNAGKHRTDRDRERKKGRKKFGKRRY